MSVTPFGMLSCAQPDSSAPAGSASTPAAAVRTRRARVLRIVTLVPYSARPVMRGAARKIPGRSFGFPTALPSGPGGRLVDAAHEPDQAQGKSAPLLFGQKAAQLALATVRLDGEPARVQACGGGGGVDTFATAPGTRP